MNDLKNIIERIERLEEEKAGVAGDIRVIYAEAKGTGFDSKAIRKVIALRKKKPEEVREEEELLATYLTAIEWG